MPPPQVWAKTLHNTVPPERALYIKEFVDTRGYVLNRPSGTGGKDPFQEEGGVGGADGSFFFVKSVP